MKWSYGFAVLSTGSPDPPQKLYHDVAANTESSAVIRWQPPLITGGSIFSYTITANGHSDSVSGDVLTYTITGLDFNTNYSIEVTAINLCGLEGEANSVTVNIEARGMRGNKCYKCMYCYATYMYNYTITVGYVCVRMLVKLLINKYARRM